MEIFPHKVEELLGRTRFARTQFYTFGTTTAGSAFYKDKIRVQAYRRGDDDLPYVRLDLSVIRPLAWRSLGIAVRLSDARELVRLLAEVTQYFDAVEKSPLCSEYSHEEPIFTQLVDWFKRTTRDGIILHSPGTIIVQRDVAEHRLCIQAFRRRRNFAPYTRLHLSATTPLSYQWLSVTIGLEGARELIWLVEQAINHFDKNGSVKASHHPACRT